MSVTVTTTWWLKHGDPGMPFESTIKINDQTSQVIGETNPPEIGVDVGITEAQYNQQVAANKAAAESGLIAIIVAKWQNLEAQKSTAGPKLLALGFTQDEVDALFRF